MRVQAVPPGAGSFDVADGSQFLPSLIALREQQVLPGMPSAAYGPVSVEQRARSTAGLRRTTWPRRTEVLGDALV